MTLRRAVGWAGELVITLGLLLLLFAAWQLWWTDVVSDRAASHAVATLEDEFSRARGTLFTSRPCTTKRSVALYVGWHDVIVSAAPVALAPGSSGTGASTATSVGRTTSREVTS